MAFDAEPHSEYLQQRIDAAQQIESLLHEDHRVLEIFREKIRFAAKDYHRYLRKIQEEEKRNPDREDVEAAWRDRRLRDHNAGPPSEDYDWRNHDPNYSNRLTEEDVRVLREEGSDVTWEEYEQAWEAKRWGYWKRRFNPTKFSLIPWLRFQWAQPDGTWDGRRFDSVAQAIPAYYCILSAIHDKDAGGAISITAGVWPDDLLNWVWQALRGWRGDHTIAIQAAMKVVTADVQVALSQPKEPAPSNDKSETVQDLLAESPQERQARHSPDYRFVFWYGWKFPFTANQAVCVRMLWEANESGCPDIGDQTLLEAAECETNRLDHLFRGNAAWGTMIVPGMTKGTRRLQPPTESE